MFMGVLCSLGFLHLVRTGWWRSDLRGCDRREGRRGVAARCRSHPAGCLRQAFSFHSNQSLRLLQNDIGGDASFLRPRLFVSGLGWRAFEWALRAGGWPIRRSALPATALPFGSTPSLLMALLWHVFHGFASGESEGNFRIVRAGESCCMGSL